MLLLTLRGTPTIYYGDEIGVQQVMLGAGEIQDLFEKRVPGLGVGRDGCRTPMQWNGNEFAGFSIAKPWLPVAPSYRACNVAKHDGNDNDATRAVRGAISFNSSIHLPPIAGSLPASVQPGNGRAGSNSTCPPLKLPHRPLRSR
jgi:alpha-glucosidase